MGKKFKVQLDSAAEIKLKAAFEECIKNTKDLKKGDNYLGLVDKYKTYVIRLASGKYLFFRLTKAAWKRHTRYYGSNRSVGKGFARPGGITTGGIKGVPHKVYRLTLSGRARSNRHY